MVCVLAEAETVAKSDGTVAAFTRAFTQVTSVGQCGRGQIAAADASASAEAQSFGAMDGLASMD